MQASARPATRTAPPRAEPAPVAPSWDRPADIRYFIGATGSGKTHGVRQHLARHRGPVLVWDFKDEWRELPAARNGRELRRLVMTRPRVRFVPDLDGDTAAQFAELCRVAWKAQLARRAALFFLVEELDTVTGPSHAPPAWRNVLVRGRVHRFIIAGTTQSPAFVDKAFTGNATYIRCGRLGELRHAKVIADRLNIDAAELVRLPDRAGYEWDGRTVRRF